MNAILSFRIMQFVCEDDQYVLYVNDYAHKITLCLSQNVDRKKLMVSFITISLLKIVNSYIYSMSRFDEISNIFGAIV